MKSPYLVLAGEDDELSPIEYTYQLFDEIPIVVQQAPACAENSSNEDLF